ncbi:hypothetical protein NIES4071_81380 [Calothrix sp. NIES-4071]|nr:hypothetical protein NIES4071_81380 [Calothrix sp. NIES-4071]BAZ62407.1 hypothetical protein NIES4105_81310 [Calothrix sp. NIES-4105]
MKTIEASRTLEDKIIEKITLAEDEVFTRKDFNGIGDYNSVGRSLRNLVKKGKMIRIGHGLYAKAIVSPFSKRVIPRKPLPELGVEVLKKFGIETFPSSYQQAYNEGRSTQVPTGRLIGVKTRIKRKIGYAGMYIAFEYLD